MYNNLAISCTILLASLLMRLFLWFSNTVLLWLYACWTLNLVNWIWHGRMFLWPAFLSKILLDFYDDFATFKSRGIDHKNWCLYGATVVVAKLVEKAFSFNAVYANFLLVNNNNSFHQQMMQREKIFYLVLSCCKRWHQKW